MSLRESDLIRLYHYLDAHWALDDIRRGRLKLSSLDDLNDPYESACVYSTHPPSQLALQGYRKSTAQSQGLQSFSRRWNNILLWAHYGAKHRGICLGFDVAMEYTRAVRYQRSIEVIGDLRQFSEKAKLAIIERLLWSKYKGWSYEEEVRAWAGRREIDAETGLYFAGFGDGLVLKEVVVGTSCPVTKQEIIAVLDGYPSNVSVRKARPNPRRFEMVLDESW